MKKRKFAISAALLVATAVTAGLRACSVYACTHVVAQAPQTVVVALLRGAERTEFGELTIPVPAKAGVYQQMPILRDSAVVPGGSPSRSSTFKLIDREHPSEVACDSKDAEYGSLTRKDGSWIGVAVCPKGPYTAAIAIPSLLRSRMSANEASASAGMTCFENKELLMGVCYKAGPSPSSAPMPQTREHILLARQVG